MTSTGAGIGADGVAGGVDNGWPSAGRMVWERRRSVSSGAADGPCEPEGPGPRRHRGYRAW